MAGVLDIAVEHDAPIATWFGVGGGADRLARPRDSRELARCLEIDPALRVLGEGANLLVDDEGVGGLVVRLDAPEWTRVEIDARSCTVRAGAGADLPKLVLDAGRAGLAGLEGLGGIPSSVGGASVMNAGGAFGQFADAVRTVYAVTRDGKEIQLSRRDIPYAYRHSGLEQHIVTRVELALTPDDPARLRDRLKEVMAYKSKSQPMSANSAGCCFKNPTLGAPIPGLSEGDAGRRVSAGLLIDRASCKGLRFGSASVSERHGNFLTAEKGGRARDIIELMALVQRRVFDAFGVTLEREVVVWER